jgi:AbrB family looped-hinge helix DNA binding protein
MQTILTRKGSLTIPSLIRHKLGIKPGTRIEVQVDEATHNIILTPITRSYINSLRGKYKGKHLLESLSNEKQRESRL